MASRATMIVDAIVERLGAMSKDTGYVLEWEKGGGAQKFKNRMQFTDLPTAVVLNPSEDKGGEYSNAIQKNLEVVVGGYVEWDQADEEFDIDMALDEAKGDIEKCLLASMLDDPPLGVPGVEIVEVLGYEKAFTEAEQLLALVRCRVQYRHNAYDPGVYP